MNTRVGKIARLPKGIRDELNRRLEDGKQGPELLAWLNALPEMKELLEKDFAGQPVSRSNLSDWRRGGYQDWLKLQVWEGRIRTVMESGDSLRSLEGQGDLFQNLARMAVAELAAELHTLDEVKDRAERWKQVREVSRELARLQNAYNRSRWAELALLKAEGVENPSSFAEASAGTKAVADGTEDGQSAIEQRTGNSGANGDREISNEEEPVVPDSARWREGWRRYVHWAPCGCMCRKCHSKDGPYPYWEAERDAVMRRKDPTDRVTNERGESYLVDEWGCDCTCARCDLEGPRYDQNGLIPPDPNHKPRRSEFRIKHKTRCECKGFCKKCHGPDSGYPLAEVLRDEAILQERLAKNEMSLVGLQRGEDGVSKLVRGQYCGCECEECAGRSSAEGGIRSAEFGDGRAETT
jgi:hypothetical protein